MNTPRSQVNMLFTKPQRKKKIPIALREATWIKRCGRVFTAKCSTPWCENKMTVFDFQCGHNIPESKGGATAIENLVPICARCNLSMGNSYTFDQWALLSPKRTWKKFFCCFTVMQVPPLPPS